MDIPPRLRVNAPHVIGESVDGEALIVNLETGAYYSATGVGDAIWTLLAEGAGVAAIVNAITARYPAAAAGESVHAFLAELVEEGLAVGDSGAEPSTAAPAGVSLPAAFTAPVLQKYTDMQDLLLLDPIHEVDDTGWPSALPGA
ncbi:MAG: PqqD family protein [Chloroflexi bacterium]|nr:PqqD family protein [Chloroflexota bacterium]